MPIRAKSNHDRKTREMTDKSSKSKVETQPAHEISQSEVNRLYASWYVYMLLGVVLAFMIPKQIPYEKLSGYPNHAPRIFTPEELARYDGVTIPDTRYLAILGKVYDVSEGDAYKEGGYSFFVGKDATRAFTSGEFEGMAKDDISDLTDGQIQSVFEWAKFYDTHETYKFVGYVIGRYYDQLGQPKPVLDKLNEALQRQKAVQDEMDQLETEFPSCNSRWSQKKGSEVWCTDDMLDEVKSHLVPRLMYIPRAKGNRCACVDFADSKDASNHKFALYPDCPPESASCKFLSDRDKQMLEEQRKRQLNENKN